MYTEASLFNADVSSGRPVVASLPLPDVPGKVLDTVNLSDSRSDAGAIVASKGGFIGGNASQQANGFSRKTVAWRLLDDNTKLVLSPLSLYNESGSDVHIVSPIRIVEDCISVFSDGNGGAIVDFIVATGFLYTVHVRSEQFHGEAFPDPSGKAWRTIKKPTALDSFSGGADPRILVSVSASMLIAGMSDHTVVKLERDGPLHEIRTTILHDPDAAQGFGAWLSGRGHVPGHPSLSLRSIVSVSQLDSHHLVTLSIDNSLRLWSLVTNKCITTIPGPSGEAPRLRPSPYIARAGTNIVVSRSGELQVFSLVNDQLQQTAVIKLPSEVRGWFLADLSYNESKDALVAAFKSHMSVKIYAISLPNNETELVLARELSDLLTLPDVGDIKELRQRVLAGDTYHPESRKYAFATCNIDAQSTEEIDADGWLRLDRLCREMEAKGMELLAVEPCGEFLWLVRGSHESLCLASSSLEVTAATVVDTATKLWASIGSKSQSMVIAELNSSVFGVDTTIIDEIENVSSGLPSDIATEFLKLGSSTFDGSVTAYLNQFNQPADPKPDAQLSDTGAAVFARLLGQKAAESLVQLRALAVFVVVASAAGVINDGVGLYARIIREIRIAEVILQLQGVGTLANALYGAVKLLKHAPFEADGYAYMWNGFDLQSDTGLKLVVDLWTQGFDLVRIVECLPATPVAVLIKGLATGDENLVNKASLPLALTASPALAELDISGKGLPHYFTVASKLLDKSLELAETACRYENTGENAEWLFETAIATGDLTLAYEAILLVSDKKRPVYEYIAQLIDCAARLGSNEADSIIRELPFIGLASEVKRAIESRDAFGSVPSYKLLYSWYVSRENYVGAAQAVYAEISQINKRAKSHDGLNADMADLFDLYAIVLNALRLVKTDRWILDDARIVTFEEVQQEHRSILKRMAAELTK